jgi:hypothetical protein
MKLSYVVFLTVLASDTREPVVTDEDRVIAKKVVEKKVEMCGVITDDSAMSEDEKAAVRSTLESSAGVDAEGMHPVETFLRNYDPDAGAVGDPLALLGITYFDIISTTQGALIAVVLMIFWFCCYHQVCCRCIPPKAKEERECKLVPVKAGFSFCSGLFALLVIISFLMAPRGALVEGSDRIFCTMGEMADGSMNGFEGSFPGFLSICEDIEALLSGVLSPPEVDATTGEYTNPDDFVPSARRILLNTEGLDRSLAVVLSSLDRIKLNSEDERNVLIYYGTCPTGVVCSGHKNLLLEQMGPKIDEVRSGLDESIAGALGTVKTEATEFLSDDNLDVLFGTVDQGMLIPLRVVKESFVGLVADQVTRDDGVPALISANMGQLEQLCDSIGINMVFFALLSFVCIFLLIKKAPVEDAEGPDKYPRYNHWTAGCTWCCGWGCTVFICIVSAMVAVIAWPFSSGCLVMLDLNRASMSEYPMFDALSELDSAVGIMESCVFEGGDGDMLGAIKVEYNVSGTMEKISAREMITLSIKGAVDNIFAPLDNRQTDEGGVEGMEDLEKALALLQNVSSFYTYAHEVENNFPSLALFLDNTDSEAADYDPRVDEQTCLDGEMSCAALGARLRIASLACESMTVPPDSFEGQPDEPLQGMGFVFASINSYPRGDALATEVSCETLDDASVVINTVTAPSCGQTDTGMCAAMCEANTTCVGLCTGVIVSSATDATAEAAYQAAIANNPDVADGIQSDEHDKYCPPVAAQRALTAFVNMMDQEIFNCYNFDCPSSDLAACAAFDEADQEFKVPIEKKTCTLAELIGTFKEAGDTLKTAIADVEAAGAQFMPDISKDLRDLIHAKMVDPFLAIIDKDKMNCGFLVTAWANLLEGACYKLGGAMASYAWIYTTCAQCGFMLVLLIFGLWRHFIDMWSLAKKEGQTVKAGD